MHDYKIVEEGIGYVIVEHADGSRERLEKTGWGPGDHTGSDGREWTNNGDGTMHLEGSTWK